MYNPNYIITDGLLNTIAQIEAVRQQVDTSFILPEREIAMHYRATVEATHSSTSIEGNPLNIKQVGKILSEKNSQLTRYQYAEIEVRNYKKALDFIDQRKKGNKKITTEDILKIHGIVAENLLEDKGKIGNWRKNPVYIQDEMGKIAYEAVEVNDVKQEIESLLKWLGDEANKVHPVIASAVLHFQFVSIHPFADGNGRTTRLLTALYLGLRNYDFRGSLVLDTYYATDKREYYKALDLASNYADRKMTNLDSWINYFSEGFLVSVNVLAAEVKMLSSVAGSLLPSKKISRAEADLLSYIHQFGSLTISEAEDILPSVSRRTIQRKLSELEKMGYIQTKGATTNLRYMLVDLKQKI